jgi:DNA transformation protein
MSDDALGELLVEGLSGLGPVRLRRMFGGAGLFLDGLMFALIADGVAYLKSDATTDPRFDAEGLGPFRYARPGKGTIAMRYRRLPERALDDPDELRDWARGAIAVARRSAVAGPGKTLPPTKRPASGRTRTGRHAPRAPRRRI